MNRYSPSILKSGNSGWIPTFILLQQAPNSFPLIIYSKSIRQASVPFTAKTEDILPKLYSQGL